MRKTSAIADLAARADAGRQLVVSVGTLDGPFLAALQRLQLAPLGDQGSTWATGVGTHNADSQSPKTPKAEGK